jgi:hypothetical protein
MAVTAKNIRPIVELVRRKKDNFQTINATPTASGTAITTFPAWRIVISHSGFFGLIIS